MQLVLFSGFLNVSPYPFILLHFIGYPLTLVSSTNLNVFATAVCLLTLRPTSLTFLPFTPLSVSFAHLLTTLSSVVHLSVQYPIVKALSYSAPSAWNALPQQVRSSDNGSTLTLDFYEVCVDSRCKPSQVR